VEGLETPHPYAKGMSEWGIERKEKTFRIPASTGSLLRSLASKRQDLSTNVVGVQEFSLGKRS